MSGNTDQHSTGTNQVSRNTEQLPLVQSGPDADADWSIVQQFLAEQEKPGISRGKDVQEPANTADTRSAGNVAVTSSVAQPEVPVSSGTENSVAIGSCPVSTGNGTQDAAPTVTRGNEQAPGTPHQVVLAQVHATPSVGNQATGTVQETLTQQNDATSKPPSPDSAPLETSQSQISTQGSSVHQPHAPLSQNVPQHPSVSPNSGSASNGGDIPQLPNSSSRDSRETADGSAVVRNSNNSGNIFDESQSSGPFSVALRALSIDPVDATGSAVLRVSGDGSGHLKAAEDDNMDPMETYSDDSGICSRPSSRNAAAPNTPPASMSGLNTAKSSQPSSPPALKESSAGAPGTSTSALKDSSAGAPGTSTRAPKDLSSHVPRKKQVTAEDLKTWPRAVVVLHRLEDVVHAAARDRSPDQSRDEPRRRRSSGKERRLSGKSSHDEEDTQNIASETSEKRIIGELSLASPKAPTELSDGKVQELCVEDVADKTAETKTKEAAKSRKRKRKPESKEEVASGEQYCVILENTKKRKQPEVDDFCDILESTVKSKRRKYDDDYCVVLTDAKKKNEPKVGKFVLKTSKKDRDYDCCVVLESITKIKEPNKEASDVSTEIEEVCEEKPEERTEEVRKNKDDGSDTDKTLEYIPEVQMDEETAKNQPEVGNDAKNSNQSVLQEEDVAVGKNDQVSVDSASRFPKKHPIVLKEFSVVLDKDVVPNSAATRDCSMGANTAKQETQHPKKLDPKALGSEDGESLKQKKETEGNLETPAAGDEGPLPAGKKKTLAMGSEDSPETEATHTVKTPSKGSPLKATKSSKAAYSDKSKEVGGYNKGKTFLKELKVVLNRTPEKGKGKTITVPAKKESTAKDEKVNDAKSSDNEQQPQDGSKVGNICPKELKVVLSLTPEKGQCKKATAKEGEQNDSGEESTHVPEKTKEAKKERSPAGGVLSSERGAPVKGAMKKKTEENVVNKAKHTKKEQCPKASLEKDSTPVKSGKKKERGETKQEEQEERKENNKEKKENKETEENVKERTSGTKMGPKSKTQKKLKPTPYRRVKLRDTIGGENLPFYVRLGYQPLVKLTRCAKTAEGEQMGNGSGKDSNRETRNEKEASHEAPNMRETETTDEKEKEDSNKTKCSKAGQPTNVKEDEISTEEESGRSLREKSRKLHHSPKRQSENIFEAAEIWSHMRDSSELKSKSRSPSASRSSKSRSKSPSVPKSSRSRSSSIPRDNPANGKKASHKRTLSVQKGESPAKKKLKRDPKDANLEDDKETPDKGSSDPETSTSEGNNYFLVPV